MTVAAPAADARHRAAYRTAFVDWLACAAAGAGERAARAVRAGGDDLAGDVAFAATAGHVLDFDDTLPDGVAHVTAATAPAALVVAAHLDRSLRDALDAYADGYEAMAALAAASHPALYDRGWHPTAVCGPVGAAVAAARLLELDDEQCRTALAVALLRAGGARGAFGSDGKAIQVGLAAAAGVQGALLARAGATVDSRAIEGPLGFTAVTGAVWPPARSLGGARGGRGGRAGAEPFIVHNWIKLHPSCLGTHAPIDAADRLRSGAGSAGGSVEVAVHPVARQAAHLDAVSDGLAAKFSIPYCVAHTLLHGPPGRRAFAALDGEVVERSRSVRVTVDDSLPQFGTVVAVGGAAPVTLECPRGAPQRPATAEDLAAKLADLAGDGLAAALARPGLTAAEALQAAGLQAAQ